MQFLSGPLVRSALANGANTAPTGYSAWRSNGGGTEQMAIYITAGDDTLMRQAPMTADLYLGEAIGDIEPGAPYCVEHARKATLSWPCDGLARAPAMPLARKGRAAYWRPAHRRW